MNERRDTPEPEAAEAPAPPDRSAFTFAVGLAAILLVVSLVIGGSLQALHIPYGIWFTEFALFFGITWMALRITGRHPLHYPGMGVPGGAALGMGFLAGALNLVAVGMPLNALMQQVVPSEWLEVFDQSQVFARQRPIDLAIIVAGVGFAAPFCEEYFFRGVFLRGLARAGMTPGRGLFVSAVVFSIFHLNPVAFVALIEVGVLFGLLYLRTGSIWPAVMAHAANNLVSTTAYFVFDAFGGGAATDGAEEPSLWVMGLFTLLFGPPLILVLAWFERRSPLLPSGPDHARPGLRPREVAVWIGGIVVSGALVLWLDYRTLAVNSVEYYVPVARPSKTAPLDQIAEFEKLEALGRSARQGEIPLEDYVEARRAAKLKLARPETPGSKEFPPVPAPTPMPAPPSP